MIRFIHMSDLHFRRSYAQEGFADILTAMRPEDNLRRCLATERDSRLDFVLLTGDLTHEGDEEDYRALRRLLDEQCSGIHVIALPGNHDCRDAYCRGYLGIPPQPTDRTVEIDGLRIIALDSGATVNGSISASQLTWLQGVLAKPACRGTLLALHHPLRSGQEGLPSAAYDPALGELIAGSDIIGIFCGHTHCNYSGQFAAKPYFTADSMAFSMDFSGAAPSYQVHAAYNLMTLCDGVLSVQVKQVALESAIAARFSVDERQLKYR